MIADMCPQTIPTMQVGASGAFLHLPARLHLSSWHCYSLSSGCLPSTSDSFSPLEPLSFDAFFASTAFRLACDSLLPFVSRTDPVMVAFSKPRLLLALTVSSAVPACATRAFQRRSDLNVPPVNASDWTIPLQGSMTCKTRASCEVNCRIAFPD
jgi:hypothetical protein